MDRSAYARAFDEVERDFEQSVEEFGLPFEPAESQPRVERDRVAARTGCHCENGSSSLWREWISPACLACRTGERTGTLFVDLRCTKDCYFCFNPNQDHYDYFLSHRRDIVREIEQASAAGAAFACLAVTGGEPLLHKDTVLAFLRRARELYPDIHIRLYTNGDLADDETLRALGEAGLTEIRFSVKPFDFDDGQDFVFGRMGRAVEEIPDVVIEMPVIPGTLEEMKAIIERADAIGVRGMNLLEFGFPLNNAEAFRERGFALRKRPFRYLYNYWYGGGIPVAGSERECLALMEFASERRLRIGIHYCSADNRNSGQVYQQNRAFDAESGLRARFPWMAHDERDRFLKCAKAFGADVEPLRAWAKETDVPYGVDEDVPQISFPLARIDEARAAVPSAAFGVSVNIVEEPEEGDGAFYMREVALEEIA